MEIYVKCTIDKETFEKCLKELNCPEEVFENTVKTMLTEEPIFEVLDDNQELFSEIKWSINEPLP
jgi:hypothetical protein